MVSASWRQRAVSAPARVRSASRRAWMSCWTMAERLACCSGPVMRVSAGSTSWAARNTAISAISALR